MYPENDNLAELLGKTDYYTSLGLGTDELIEILKEQDYDQERKEIDDLIKKMGSSLLLGSAISGTYNEVIKYNESWAAQGEGSQGESSVSQEDFVVNVDEDMLKNTLLESKLNQDLLRVNSHKAHQHSNDLLEIEKAISNASDVNRLNIHDFNMINSLHIKKLTLAKSIVSKAAHLKVIKTGQIKLLVTLGSFFLG